MKEEAKNRFENSFKELENIDDKKVHDYLYYMIMDLLQSENITFITENEIRESTELYKLLDGFIPDFIIKSDESKCRKKPMILDIYIGKNEDTVNKKKSKYQQMRISFDVEGLTMANYSSILTKIIPQKKVHCLYNQFQTFLTKHHYRRACSKMNDVVKMTFDFSEKFETSKMNFKLALIQKASHLLNNKGL
jgi:hypothetical protein